MAFHVAADALFCSSCQPPTVPSDRYEAAAIGGRLRWRLVSRAADDAASLRSDPEATGRVYVSLALDWFLTPLETLLGANVTLQRHRFGPDGVYRRLDRPYFAWLTATAHADGMPEATFWRLLEVVTAAQQCGVLGEWASDPAKWPTLAPPRYLDPRPFLFSWGDA